MNYINPINQTKLFGMDNFINDFIKLDSSNKLPNKILLTGLKGIGKSTLAYHLINYCLSKNENFNYDIENYEINTENTSFKTVLNKSNPNLITIDVNDEKKSIDINQIRELILKLNKSSFNSKPRFVLIDNIEFLNINSTNALLKILEEPTFNVHFILINNASEKILPTLYSRCVNYKISLSNSKSIYVANKLLNGELNKIINNDLISYYSTPGNIYKLAEFAKLNKYDLSNTKLKEFLMIIFKDEHYKKKSLIEHLIFDFIQSYFRIIKIETQSKIFERYDYFLKKISNTKKFNLDEESLFIELKEEILCE
tara:strand:- start:2207 stop:3142 length:936 start_codon:yes stop_codon:yes gene_type:complete